MTGIKDTMILAVVNPICCGVDVHKKSLSACLLGTDEAGEDVYEVREYGTFTDELYRFLEWLQANKCKVVVIESTGIYWRPVYNVLEGHVEVKVVNARHIKNVPGRKTDIEDSKWLAGLLRFGLLRGSFIPEKRVRELRDLTRARRGYIEEMSDNRRRVHKLFESANVKIDSVVSDLFGVTGRKLMKLLISGKKMTQKDIDLCVHGRLKGKESELYRSITGFFSDHHRFLLKTFLKTLESIEQQIEAIDERLSKLMNEETELVERLSEAPGISETSARYIISEIGTKLTDFATDAHLVSWCGLCPGNNESAGKRKSGKSPVRRHHLKSIMIESAWAAVKKKGSYYKAKFYSLKARRGAKRAIVAIANRLLKGVYHVIKDGLEFKDPGEEYLASLNKEAKIKRLEKQANLFGYTLMPISH